MPEPTPTPTFPDHLSTVLAGHRACRRDTGRFIHALGRLDPSDHATARALGVWFDAAMQALHHHHTIEDEIFWPALRERSRAFAVTDQLMHDEHAALDAAIADATDAVHALGGTTTGDCEARRHAEDAVVRMRAILVEHLAHEEATALPLLAEALTVEEYHRLDRQVTELSSRRSSGSGPAGTSTSRPPGSARSSGRASPRCSGCSTASGCNAATAGPRPCCPPPDDRPSPLHRPSADRGQEPSPCHD